MNRTFTAGSVGSDRTDLTEIRCLKALVSSAFAVGEEDFRAPSRCRARIAFARQVAMYLAHVGFGMTLGEVARVFGRHRSTAAHACRTVEDRRDDRALDYSLDRLEAAARLWVDAARSTAALGHG